ncbi:hypothetical protein [Hyphomonas sp.]|uniref:hypothetical protein n=1 Tax=Hyphomonas sp. TaxID=87 RepID=UPI003918D9D8
MKDVSTQLRLLVLASLAGLLAGCASIDAQDQFVLGAATRQNIAEQSVRDVNLPNSKQVEGSSGVQAAKAVRALNEGRAVRSAEAQTANGGTP